MCPKRRNFQVEFGFETSEQDLKTDMRPNNHATRLNCRFSSQASWTGLDKNYESQVS